MIPDSLTIPPLTCPTSLLNPTISPASSVLQLSPVANRYTASKILVFPEPLGPTIKVIPGENSSDFLENLRKSVKYSLFNRNRLVYQIQRRKSDIRSSRLSTW